MRRMAKDMEGLHTAEVALQEMQKVRNEKVIKNL